jgi:hypothetical protein
MFSERYTGTPVATARLAQRTSTKTSAGVNTRIKQNAAVQVASFVVVCCPRNVLSYSSTGSDLRLRHPPALLQHPFLQYELLSLLHVVGGCLASYNL